MSRARPCIPGDRRRTLIATTVLRGAVRVVEQRAPWLKRFVARRWQPTVSQGWDLYARCGPEGDQQHLGDEWNSAEEMGLDVATDGIVPFNLD